MCCNGQAVHRTPAHCHVIWINIFVIREQAVEQKVRHLSRSRDQNTSSAHVMDLASNSLEVMIYIVLCATRHARFRSLGSWKSKKAGRWHLPGNRNIYQNVWKVVLRVLSLCSIVFLNTTHTSTHSRMHTHHTDTHTTQTRTPHTHTSRSSAVTSAVVQQRLRSPNCMSP